MGLRAWKSQTTIVLPKCFAASGAVLDEGVDGADQLRVRGVRRHVEDPDLAVVEPPGPEVTAVVAEARMMRLVPAAERHRGDHLAVMRRVRGGGADGDQLIGAVAHALDAERHDVDVVLLPGDLGHVRRHAGLVGAGRGGNQQHGGQRRARDEPRRDESCHGNAPPWAVSLRAAACRARRIPDPGHISRRSAPSSAISVATGSSGPGPASPRPQDGKKTWTGASNLTY